MLAAIALSLLLTQQPAQPDTITLILGPWGTATEVITRVEAEAEHSRLLARSATWTDAERRRWNALNLSLGTRRAIAKCQANLVQHGSKVSNTTCLPDANDR